jgi:Uma2 family endonuclease
VTAVAVPTVVTPTAATRVPPPEVEVPQRLVFTHADWAFYQEVSRRLAGRRVFITYRRGRLEVVTTSFLHEMISALLTEIVRTLAEETNTPFKPAGRATLAREDLDEGTEPDASFYVANQPRMRGRGEIRLPDDPPPDLAIEVEVTRRLGERRTIYQELGVPEVWTYAVAAGLTVLLRQADGTYAAADRSPTFPLLSPAELTSIVQSNLPFDDQTAFTKVFRRRVREAIEGRPS